MLPEKIAALARKTAALQMKDLDQPLAIAMGRVQAEHRGAGRMFIYIFELYRREIVVRADVVWRNLHRAHNSMGAPYPDALRADLRNAFRAQLDEVVSDLSPRFEKD